MNHEIEKAAKKVWNTPNFEEISVEETLSGTWATAAEMSNYPS